MQTLEAYRLWNVRIPKALGNLLQENFDAGVVSRVEAAEDDDGKEVRPREFPGGRRTGRVSRQGLGGGPQGRTSTHGFSVQLREQLRERKNGALVPKRHQMKLCNFDFLGSGPEARKFKSCLPPAILS